MMDLNSSLRFVPRPDSLLKVSVDRGQSLRYPLENGLSNNEIKLN